LLRDIFYFADDTIENGKILTEARYRFDVLTEPEVSNDPGNSDSPPIVPEELMHLFQSEIYESDDSSVSVVFITTVVIKYQKLLIYLVSCI
jgi:hypothetical protein